MKASISIHQDYPGEAHEKLDELVKALGEKLEGVSHSPTTEASVFQAERELNTLSETIFSDQISRMLSDIHDLLLEELGE